MFMHSQCVYVQCVICVYCVHVYPLDVHCYYPLDKEERSYSVFSPISTATNCCTSNNEKERERDGIYRLHSRPPSALPVSVTKWTWGPNKQKQWKTQKKGSKQLTNPFLFWWLQASRWFLFVVLPSLSLFFLCTQDSRLVCLSFFLCCVEMFHDCQLLLFVYSSLLRPRRASPDWLSLTFGVTALRCRSPRGNAPWIFLEAAGQFSSPPYSFSSGSLV